MKYLIKVSQDCFCEMVCVREEEQWSTPVPYLVVSGVDLDANSRSSVVWTNMLKNKAVLSNWNFYSGHGATEINNVSPYLDRLR